jgi:hypothetical protein
MTHKIVPPGLTAVLVMLVMLVMLVVLTGYVDPQRAQHNAAAWVLNHDVALFG